MFLSYCETLNESLYYELISEIENHPVLWDIKDKFYKAKNKKNDGWINVATLSA